MASTHDSMTTAAAPSAADLESALEQHRRELTGYCYRMLGAGAEAEDAVQETFVRAWRAFDRFEGRSSLRSWLYRIASNVCVDMHRSPQRRARPMDLGPSRPAAGSTPGDPLPEHAWVQPVADERVIDVDGDPADVAAARETVRLAFVAALQHLPPRQRAALILCEVLKWSAAETAELLETSVAAINSALQRARATLAEVHRDPVAGDPRLDPIDDPDHQALLARYVDAFERYDMDALVLLLRDDAVLSMPPFPLWLTSASDVVSWMSNQGIGCRGSKLIPMTVNGTAGFASYKPSDDDPGRLDPWAIQVIEVRDGAISAHHNFIGPELFAEHGLPDHLPA
jgi:RNA polymerase sigma-70 factor, ECF subfamily